jgi:hypothetical protein
LNKGFFIQKNAGRSTAVRGHYVLFARAKEKLQQGCKIIKVPRKVFYNSPLVHYNKMI